MTIGRIDFVAPVYVPGQGNESDVDPVKEKLSVEACKGDEFGLPGVQGFKLSTLIGAQDFGPVFVPLSNVAGVHLLKEPTKKAEPAKDAKAGK